MTGIVVPDGGNIGSASDTDAISIPANGKPTFSAGIANTGTIDAGTLGSSIIHSIGWQHIADKHHTSSSSTANYFEFQNVFSNDYIMFCIYVGQINFAQSSSDFHFRLMNSSGNINTAQYYGATHRTEHDQGSDQNAYYSGESKGYFINNMEGNSANVGAHGHIWIYNVTSPTILGTSVDRGTNYRPFIRAELQHYNMGTNSYGLATSDWRYNVDQTSSYYTGINIYGRKGDATADANLMAGSHISLWGLKGKATA